MRTTWLIFVSAFCVFGAQAQLAVTISSVKVSGNKAVVPLAMKNNLTEKIESARAVVFLLDEHGKMVGQSTKWVIGGSQDKPGLAAGATNAFHFVITADKPFTTTNLRLASISRLRLFRWLGLPAAVFSIRAFARPATSPSTF